MTAPAAPTDATPLVVWTARLAYAGADRLDVSRWGNDPLGVAFAPSERLLYAFKALTRAGRATRAAFGAYAERYRAEMLASRAARPAAWAALRARGVATLCCYCENPAACHRRVLAALLAELDGARDEGER